MWWVFVVADRGVAVRVVDHQIGVGARLDDAFLSVQPEHPGRGGRGQLDPTGQRDLTSDHPWIHQVHPVLDAADAVGMARKSPSPSSFCSFMQNGQ